MSAIPAPDLIVRVTFQRFAEDFEAGRFSRVLIGRHDFQVIRPGDGPPVIETIATRGDDGFWRVAGADGLYPDVIVSPVGEG